MAMFKLKELSTALEKEGFDLAKHQVTHQQFDKVSDMGYLYFVERETAKGENYRGSDELGGVANFLVDWQASEGKDIIRGLEVFWPQARGFVDPQAETFGYDYNEDKLNEGFEKLILKLRKLWKQK